MTAIPGGPVNTANHADMKAGGRLLIRGQVIAMATASEARDTSNGGTALNFTFTVTHGSFKGRNFYSSLNLVNKSEKAVQIAKEELATMTRAAFGKDFDLHESEHLHNRPMLMTVDVEVDPTGKYKPRTVPVGYAVYVPGEEPDDPVEVEVEEVAPAAPSAPSAPTPPQAATAGNAPTDPPTAQAPAEPPAPPAAAPSGPPADAPPAEAPPSDTAPTVPAAPAGGSAPPWN